MKDNPTTNSTLRIYILWLREKKVRKVHISRTKLNQGPVTLLIQAYTSNIHHDVNAVSCSFPWQLKVSCLNHGVIECSANLAPAN